MWNFPYHIARREGAACRRLYQMCLPAIVARKVSAPREISLDVFSYSGESTLPEQIASIRSFLRYAGRPKSFTVFSDGTHSRRSVDLLHKIDSVVRVSTAPPPVSSNLPEKLQEYLRAHPTGKQLAFIMSLPVDRPTLYMDSDVLFFPGALDLVSVAQTKNVSALYLADCQFSGDARLLRDESEQRDPVNTGFLLLFRRLDWSAGLQRYLDLAGAPIFFTNQTIAHVTMHANGARPFDPAKYILQLDDEFIYSDRHARPSIAMRHYVNPVRHKFWTRFAR